MAQRTVHLLLGHLLAGQLPVGDKNRFLLGNLLPDAVPDYAGRTRSHFLLCPEDDRRTSYDIAAFRALFGALAKEDDLCLGYYAHLETDRLYRRYLYEEAGLLQCATAEQMAVLYGDYARLNGWIAEKYSLPGIPVVPADFWAHPLASLAPFEPEKLLAACRADLTQRADHPCVMLTEAGMEAFLHEALQELPMLCGGILS